jgi:SAM-dependent methyltransferase
MRLISLAHAQPGYDVIFLNHVLEHVADPLMCVEQIEALLAPGGIAYFEMPCADYRFKSDVFPHTWFFTPDALSHFASRSGANEVLREVFGRLPGSSASDLLWRAAYRASAELDINGLAGYFDERMWAYATRNDGIWIRWMLQRRV